MQSQRAFENTLLVAPVVELGSLADQCLRAEFLRVLDLLETPDISSVVVDLAGAPYFGASMLGMLAELWRTVRSRRGRFILCNVSPHGRQVLATARLDSVWPICSSRHEALEQAAMDQRMLISY